MRCKLCILCNGDLIPYVQAFCDLLYRITGGKEKSTAISVSPTLRAVLREDRVRKRTGYKPNVNFYHHQQEYGPGYGPLRQYEETPDTLCQTITSYNRQQDRSLTYPMWAEC